MLLLIKTFSHNLSLRLDMNNRPHSSSWSLWISESEYLALLHSRQGGVWQVRSSGLDIFLLQHLHLGSPSKVRQITRQIKQTLPRKPQKPSAGFVPLHIALLSAQPHTILMLPNPFCWSVRHCVSGQTPAKCSTATSGNPSGYCSS